MKVYIIVLTWSELSQVLPSELQSCWKKFAQQTSLQLHFFPHALATTLMFFENTEFSETFITVATTKWLLTHVESQVSQISIQCQFFVTNWSTKCFFPLHASSSVWTSCSWHRNSLYRLSMWTVLFLYKLLNVASRLNFVWTLHHRQNN